MMKLKKFARKMILMLAAAALLVSMGLTAFAAGGGTITITGTTAGKTYDIYRIFDLTYSGENVAYTINSAWSAFFTGVGAKYLVDTNPGSLNPITVESSAKYINITDSNVAQFAQDALSYAAGRTPDQSAQASGDSLSFSGLELGYYLVYPQGAAEIGAGYGSICSLTSTAPSGTVVVKATYPTIDKTVDDQSVDVGQLVTFTITGKVPDTTGYKVYTYKLTDKMDAGLTFNEATANLKVLFGDAVITDGSFMVADNGFTLTFDMTKYQPYAGKTITVSYSARVNENAVITETKNRACLEYSNDPNGGTEKTPDEIVEVWTNKILVDKFNDVNTETKLAGAKFVLKNAAGKYYKYTPASGQTPASVSWLDNLDVQDAGMVRTTDVSGAAAFEGLADGTYTLVEIEAPQGYNLPANTETEITVRGQKPTGSLYTVGVAVTQGIGNTTGTVLPETGGRGTQTLYMLGGLMMAAACALFAARRRLFAA